MDVSCDIEREIAVLSESGGSKKALTLTRWANRPAKLDIRVWRTVDGETKAGKGIALTDDEAQSLLEALTDYFHGGK